MRRDVLGAFAEGSLPPLPVRSIRCLGDHGFRTMAAADHIGKLVLTVPGAGSPAGCPNRDCPCEDGGAYIITGGLSGLGLAAASWLASRGAGHWCSTAAGRRPPRRPDVAR